MARTKSYPMRNSSYGATSTVVSGPSLNTRIHRILNKQQEMKIYYGDTSYTQPAVGTGWLGYVNPLNGIIQGSGATERIGDAITVYKIEITAITLVSGSTDHEARMDTTTRLSLLRVPDYGWASAGTFTARYAGTGWNSTGPLDTNHNTVLADKRYFRPATQTATGYASMRFPNYLSKKFARGVKVEFQNASTLQATKNMIIVFAGDVPVDITTGTSEHSMYIAYAVYYRDS